MIYYKGMYTNNILRQRSNIYLKLGSGFEILFVHLLCSSMKKNGSLFFPPCPPFVDLFSDHVLLLL
jgi:hypothetical protein